MTDLQTLANEINEMLAAAKAPLFVLPGKRAIKWAKAYSPSEARKKTGYVISKGAALQYLVSYDLAGLAQ